MKRPYLILYLLLISCIGGFAQTGNDFWFAVPYIDATHDNSNADLEIDGITKKQTGSNYFRISTGEAGAIVEFYYYPGGGASNETLLFTKTVPSNSVEEVTLDDDAPYDISLKRFTNRLESTINDRGIHIISNNPVTIYYEIGSYNNTEIFALKGEDALGLSFYPSFQTTFENELQGAYATDSWTSADIVATEDNTTVSIVMPTATHEEKLIQKIYRGGYNYNPGTGLAYYSMDPGPFYMDMVTEIWDNGALTSSSYVRTWYIAPAIYLDASFSINWSAVSSEKNQGSKITFPTTTSSSITLDKGESYSFSSKTEGTKKALKLLTGIRITSDKPIAVTSKDDSSKDGWAADVIGDQQIPTSLGGECYIVPDFQTIGGASMDQGLYIRAISNGTDINIQGETNPVATLNAGEIYSFGKFSNNDSYKLISTTSGNPFMCFQISGMRSGDVTQTEFGGAMIPPVDRCTGSTQAAFNIPGNASEYKIALISRTNNLSSFSYKEEGSASWTNFIPALAGVVFTTMTVPGYGDWYVTFLDDYFAPLLDKNYILKNSESTFHLGVLSRVVSGGSLGAFYGYFSDYSEPTIQLGFDFKDHDANPATENRVFLYAFGGVEGSYSWDMLRPVPASTSCSDNFFDEILNLPACNTANPVILNEDILDLTEFYRYKATGQSTCFAIPKLTAQVQFEVIGRIATFVPLPIELASFNATCNYNSIVLDWATMSETNNEAFYIYQSTDGVNFKLIGTIDGQGNSSKKSLYSFIDKSPVQGMNYYKLVQKDFDGKTSESKVVSANCRQQYCDDVFPTICRQNETITIVCENYREKWGRIVSILGVEVETFKLDNASNQNTIRLSIPQGTYFLQLFDEDQIITNQKIIVK